jgi:hypothetical protein
MFAFKEIYAERARQLKVQHDLDKQLKGLPCVVTVNEYLFKVRKDNRDMMKEYDDIPFYSIPRITTGHLAVTNADIEDVKKALQTDYPCYYLANLLWGKKGLM